MWSALGSLGYGQISQFKPKEGGFGKPSGGVLSKGCIRHTSTGRQDRLLITRAEVIYRGVTFACDSGLLFRTCTCMRG